MTDLQRSISRRDFTKAATLTLASGSLAAGAPGFPVGATAPGQLQQPEADEPLFHISLAQWSLHRTIRAGGLENLDFPKFALDEFGIDAVEYVNQFFMDKAEDENYLRELKKRTGDAGSKSLLIMVDGEGALGDADPDRRAAAIRNHHKWVLAAKLLGCHSIRVNAQSSGSYEDQMKRAAEGLRALTEYGAQHELNVIVENHGGWSSHGRWLADVIRMVDHPRCGTLPDFGNFRIMGGNSDLWYDRYLGTWELMPYAKAVSAKSHDFDDDGEERSTDFTKMMRIVLASGYRGYIGIEYEGGRLPEVEGIRATKRLLEGVREKLAADPQFAG